MRNVIDMQSEQCLSQDFLTKLLEFLARNQWIYDFQLTRFLCDGVWENIPEEWRMSLCTMTTEEINRLPLGETEPHWPQSLRDFVQEAVHLSLARSIDSETVTPIELSQNAQKGMKPKKRHEVRQMSAWVHKICRESNCRNVVDVGAGLGYLSYALQEECGYNVLALECEECKTHRAESRASELNLAGVSATTFQLARTERSFLEFDKLLSSTFSTSSQNNKAYCTGAEECDSQVTKNFKHTVNSPEETVCTPDCTTNHSCVDSSSVYDKISANKDEHRNSCCDERTVPSENCCLTGLHCCGPLTPAMLELFVSNERLKSLVLVSCCYHSMPVVDEQCSTFPVSSTVTHLCQCARKKIPEWKMSTFALRLAAQETRARWQRQTAADHEYHTRNVGYRALLEMSQQDENFVKLRRRIARAKDYEDFDTYLSAIFNRTSLDRDQYDRLKALHEEQSEHFKFIEPFTALQVLLQGPLETLICLDRILYLKEEGISNCKLVPIFDDLISPRNMALIATK